MAENTKIEWCDHTFNPWIGCTKISPGCAHCYAEKLDVRFGGGHWGTGAPRKRTSAANWKQPLRWNEAAAVAAHGRDRLGEPQKHRPRVFCASLADWLDDELTIMWLAELLELIHSTPNLDWLLLTKRPENWRARIDLAERFKNFRHSFINSWCRGVVPHNVWVGATIEKPNEKRINDLLAIPARMHFVSCEPLLADLDLKPWFRETNPLYRMAPDCPAIDWVIAGCESGPKRRSVETRAFRSLRDQCRAAGVPFFLKQMEVDGKLVKMPALDGVVHNELPEIRP